MIQVLKFKNLVTAIGVVGMLAAAPVVLAKGSPSASAVTPASNGTITTFILGASNVAGFPSQEMGRLRIEQIGVDTKWTLSANWDNKYNSSNPFVFGLDYSMKSGSISQSSLPLFDVVGQIGVKSFGSSGVFFNPSNNTNRFTDGESASWLFKNTNLNSFLIKDLHVNAIYNGQSVKFAPMTPVPEPETYAMMLAGLAAIGLLRKKKAKLA